MNIQIKKLYPNVKIPTHGSEESAGYDLYAYLTSQAVIPPHSTVKIGTGIAMALPKNTFAAIFARSGLALTRGLRPANCVGVCDSDYRGEYVIAIHNDTDEEVAINPGERIAQVVLLPYFSMDFEIVDELDDTARGTGGFGSTGKF